MQVVFPEEFAALKLSDKPDLIDETLKMGIEVTYPTDEKQEELTSYFYNTLHGKTITEIPQKGLSVFRSNSYDIIVDSKSKTISAFARKAESFDIRIVYNAIRKKIERLNSDLYSFSDNASLYLEMRKWSEEAANYIVAKNILTFAKEESQKYELSFNEVFYDCIFTLYRLNVRTNTIQEIDISDLSETILLEYDKNRIKESDAP